MKKYHLIDCKFLWEGDVDLEIISFENTDDLIEHMKEYGYTADDMRRDTRPMIIKGEDVTLDILALYEEDKDED